MIVRNLYFPLFPCQINYQNKKRLKNTKNKPGEQEKNVTEVNCDVFRVFLGEPLNKFSASAMFTAESEKISYVQV